MLVCLLYFLFGEISACVFYHFLIELFGFVTVEFLSVRASIVAQLVTNLPTMWETWVRSLGWEDALEKGKATHSSILAWRIPWTV